MTFLKGIFGNFKHKNYVTFKIFFSAKQKLLYKKKLDGVKSYYVILTYNFIDDLRKTSRFARIIWLLYYK